MLQINEMRIGNYFFADEQPQSLSAICIEPGDVAAPMLVGFYKGEALNYISADSQRLQAMPITDVILESCGFKFDAYFRRWQKKRMVFGPGVDMELDRDYTALDFSGQAIVKEIKYLHQLQNLYYALKRQEMLVNVQLNERMQMPASM